MDIKLKTTNLGNKQCMGCMEFYSEEYDTCPFCGYQEGTSHNDLLHMDPGTILNGQYIIGNTIGSGGFGVTYIGWDMKLKRKVAIKEYFPSEFATRMIHQQDIMLDQSEKKQKQFTDGMKKFLKEGRNLARVGNIDGVVHMYDCFEANHTAYIAMEYLKGETLESYLERVGKVEEKQAMDLIMPVIGALETIHEQGIIHRDIAPDNIFLAENPDGTMSVKLIDFGAAKFATTSHSKSLTVIIKPGYSPEEQYRSNGDQGTYTDVYALAAVLYRMVTGVQPPDAFERRTMIETKKKDLLVEPGKINKNLSANFEIALLNAMNVRIEDRTQTIAGFESELISFEPVKRHGSTIRKIDFMRWPLWAKIGVPVGAVAAVAVIVFAIFKVFSDAEVMYTLPDGMTYVPDFVATDFDEAQKWAEESNLILASAGSEYALNAETNRILRQDVDAGMVTVNNTQVNVNVSSGVEKYAMPDLTGYDLEQAKTIVECMGVEIDTEEGAKAGLADGCIISQSIDPYEEVQTGDVVTLVVNRQSGASGIVPDVVGMSWDKALDESADLGVALKINQKVFSDSTDAYEIIEQDTKKGESVSENAIGITVSIPVHQFSMPNLIYKDQEAAVQLMDNIGVQCEIVEEESEIIQKGLVAGQDIKQETEVTPGDKQKITISKGGKPFDMPDIAGLDEKDAKDTLAKSGLAVLIEYAYDEAVPEGCVIGQSVSKGEKVTRGTEITLTICSMQGIVTVADTSGMGKASAIAALEKDGFEVEVVEVYSENVGENKVISQLPAAGTSQIEGSTVVITVSKGRDPKKVKEEEELKKKELEEKELEEKELEKELEEKLKKKEVGMENASWSGWGTAIPSGDCYVESKTQYRARTKETTTSTSSSMSGWTLVDTKSQWSEFGGWSDWTESPVTAGEDREVETKLQYAYSDRYVSGYNYGNWGDWTTNYIGANDTTDVETKTENGQTSYHYAHWCWSDGSNWQSWDWQWRGDAIYHDKGWSTTLWPNAFDGQGGYTEPGMNSSNRAQYWCSNKCWRYYIVETSTPQITYYRARSKSAVYDWYGFSSWQDTPVSASESRQVQTRTLYRSRTRTKNYTYTYARWGDWSAWSDSPVSGDEVQTQTVYRYAAKYQ